MADQEECCTSPSSCCSKKKIVCSLIVLLVGLAIGYFFGKRCATGVCPLTGAPVATAPAAPDAVPAAK